VREHFAKHSIPWVDGLDLWRQLAMKGKYGGWHMLNSETNKVAVANYMSQFAEAVMALS